jgi:glycosyltransferase involved in cell wall biosynthesis/LmbE family N-acetylglucosaminyl deacetylase
MRGTRIAFVSQPGAWGGPPDPQGSIEIWTHETARRLALTSTVRVYRPMATRFLRTAYFDGVEYLGVPNRYDRALVPLVNRLSNEPGRPRNLSVFRFIAYAVQVAWNVRRFHPDVIHVQNQFAFGRILRRLNPSTPIVLHMHGDWLSELDHDFVAPAVRAVDQVITCSDHLGTRADRVWSGPAWRRVTVPNGVDESWLEVERAESPSPEILFVGRMSPEKGLHHLIEAFIDIAGRHTEVRLKIIGPHALLPRESIVDVAEDADIRALERFYRGPKYWDQLEAMIPPALADRIDFIHSMPQRQLVDHYRTAAMLVNPSLSESFGMSLVEAMSVGCPVIGTTAGGMPEVVDEGVTGLLVPPADTAALSAAIEALLADPALRRRMGEAGRVRVAGRFTWDSIAESVSTVYAGIMTGVRKERRAVKRYRRLVEKATPLDPATLEGASLIIAPHPDDEALGCGGTMAALTGAGRQVGVVFMTDGGLAGPGGRRMTASERNEEARQACEVLGVKPANTWMFDFPDGGLGRNSAEATERLRAVLDEFAPRRVFVPHSNDVHPDHVASYRITMAALAERGVQVDVFEYPIWLWDHWPWTPQPGLLPPSKRTLKLARRAWTRSLRQLSSSDIAGLGTAVDVSGALWVKRTALDMYRSQLPSLGEVGGGRFLEWFDKPTELFRVTR